MSERTHVFDHPVKLYVYRRLTPPAFITFPGSSTSLCRVVAYKRPIRRSANLATGIRSGLSSDRRSREMLPGHSVYLIGHREPLQKGHSECSYSQWRCHSLFIFLQFDVCLTLGETELAARLRWKEDVRTWNSRPFLGPHKRVQGVDTYGPATVAYE